MSEALLKFPALFFHVDRLRGPIVLNVGEFRVQVGWILEKRLSVLRVQRNLVVQIVFRVLLSLDEVLEWSLTESPLILKKKRVLNLRILVIIVKLL